MLLLLELLHEHGPLLVLAAFVLEPDANNSRAEARHLHQLLLHERVRPRVGVVTCAQCVQLLLIEHSADPSCLLRLLVDVVAVWGLAHRYRLCQQTNRNTALTLGNVIIHIITYPSTLRIAVHQNMQTHSPRQYCLETYFGPGKKIVNYEYLCSSVQQLV